jgi:single-strand DNA-binding protein
LATNRSWTTDTGEKHEETEFHRIVAWNKLAELCSQFLVKGRKVYVEGRLANRQWKAQDGSDKSVTEVVIDDMILLDSRGGTAGAGHEEAPATPPARKKPTKEESIPDEDVPSDDVAPDDIPF